MATGGWNISFDWHAAQLAIARGIFSDQPARLRGTFDAWFFYIHRRNASWNALTTYTREGGDQGIIAPPRQLNRSTLSLSQP